MRDGDDVILVSTTVACGDPKMDITAGLLSGVRNANYLVISF
jgi:hypothetical protein